MMETPEQIICRLFNDPAPIVFITGRHGRGKTDFGLLIAEILLKNGIIKKFGSNIKVLDSKGYDYTHITNLVRLKRWLKKPKRIHKAFILDEAGIHADRRNPLGRLTREFRYLGFLLRKYRCKLMLISQRSKDIESTFADTDIWLGTFKKISKTEAILISNIFEEPYYISDIPKTSIQFDTYDIAPFTLEPEKLSEEMDTFEMKILCDWLECGSYNKVAKKYGMFAQEVKRIVIEQVKALLYRNFEK